jgi:hypothetical protein
MGNTNSTSPVTITIAPISPIPYGTTPADLNVSVTLTANSSAQPSGTDVLVVSLKTPCCSPQVVSPPQQIPWTEGTTTGTWTTTGPITVTFSNLTLSPGDYEVEVKFAGDTTVCPPLDPACYTQGFCVCGPPEVEPLNTSCTPCSDPIQTVNRVMRDRTVSDAVSELLQGAAQNGFSSLLSPPAAGSNVNKALTTLSNAFAGKDAVRAKGECCHGQLHLETYIRDSVGGRYELLKRELRQNIPVQLIDANNDLAANIRNSDDREDLFSEVEAGLITLAFPSDIVEGAELSDYYEVQTPGDRDFKSFTRAPIEQGTNTQSSGETAAAGKSGTIKGTIAGLEGDVKDLFRKKKSGGKTTPTGRSIEAERSDIGPGGDEQSPIPTPGGFQALIWRGGDTTMRCFLNPPLAEVRCFSLLEDKGCGCLPGKQFISCVAISVWRGDRRVTCNPTGDSGCTGFKLGPGWYTFSAPECVNIEGCNYALASNSPVSAFLGAGQCCSDIYFRYKKKGNEIQVISKICYPDASNPYVEAFNNFAGMQYLLVSDSDPTFVPQQQTTADGSAFCFRNLPAGAYSLYCQAPPTYGAQPVQPVNPEGGRLSLTVFGGQNSAVPVEVKFRTCTTAPAVLNGVVRDEYGLAIPGQLVKFLDNQGRVKGAAVTNTQGVYTFQMYTAEDVMIVFASQQFAVSKAQIQAVMKTVGTPQLPSPDATMEGTVQRAELVGGFGD